MSAWILIFWIGVNSQGGPATAEFADKTSCESALKIADKKWLTFDGVCVPKANKGELVWKR